MNQRKFGNSDWTGVVWNGQVIGGPPGGPRPPQAPTTGGMTVHRVGPQGPVVVSTNPQAQQPVPPQMMPPQMMPQALPPQMVSGMPPMMPQLPPGAGWPQAMAPAPAPAWTPPPAPPPTTTGSPGVFRLGSNGGMPTVQPAVHSQPLPPMQVPQQQWAAPAPAALPPAVPTWGASSPLPGAPAPIPSPAPGPAPTPVPASYEPVPSPVAPAAPAPAAVVPPPLPSPPPAPEHSIPAASSVPPPPMEGAPAVQSTPTTSGPSAPDAARFRPGPISTTPVHIPGLNLQSDQIVMPKISPEQMLVANATQNPPMGSREITDHERPVMRTVYGVVNPETLQRGHVQPRFGQFVKEAPNANTHVPAAQNVRVPFGHSQVMMPPPPDPTRIRR